MLPLDSRGKVNLLVFWSTVVCRLWSGLTFFILILRPDFLFPVSGFAFGAFFFPFVRRIARSFSLFYGRFDLSSFLLLICSEKGAIAPHCRRRAARSWPSLALWGKIFFPPPRSVFVILGIHPACEGEVHGWQTFALGSSDFFSACSFFFFLPFFAWTVFVGFGALTIILFCLFAVFYGDFSSLVALFSFELAIIRIWWSAPPAASMSPFFSHRSFSCADRCVLLALLHLCTPLF